MYINKKEAVFWRQLISKYLYPITMDKDQKSRLSEELKSLRNNVSMPDITHKYKEYMIY